MARGIKTKLRKEQARSYLNKDFSGFRNDLLLYARTFFEDQIQDFSEASMGGLLIDMAAYVGDVMAYYLDHQLGELNIETAVEPKNIEKLLRASGTKIGGAAPAIATVDFYIQVPVSPTDPSQPNGDLLPIIKQGTTAISSAGVTFELTTDLNFSSVAVTKQEVTDIDDNIIAYTLKLAGTCRSGKIITDTFGIPDTFVSFRTITLGATNISEIISVKDTQGNEYYEVEALNQDVVFKRVLNAALDVDLVPENLELIPAPFRFVAFGSRQTGVTTLRFGSGRADTLDDDIVPDPSELSLPLYEKKTFSQFSIDPNNLLQTSTLGISPVNTTLTVRYRAGGGLSHNVAANTIRSISKLLIRFKTGVSASSVSSVRASVQTDNPSGASGGENPPSLNELRGFALAQRFAQSRIVTKEDLIARIYTMPSNFGRVFRVGVRANENNPLSSVMHIISRDQTGALIVSPDSLKENLRLYLNEHRLIADAIDILDTAVINIGFSYNIVIDAISNKELVIQTVNSKIRDYMKIENFQIDQPVITSDIKNIILNQDGVVSLANFEVNSYSGTVDTRTYSDIIFNPSDTGPNMDRAILYGIPGSIFELKYPDDDIVGNAL